MMPSSSSGRGLASGVPSGPKILLSPLYLLSSIISNYQEQNLLSNGNSLTNGRHFGRSEQELPV